MLLGLAIAVLLALALQLNALRVKRTDSFYMSGDGAICLKAWIVVETEALPGLAWAAGAVRAIGRRPTAVRIAGRVARLRERLSPVRRVARRAQAPIAAHVLEKLRGAFRHPAALSTGPPPWQVPRPPPNGLTSAYLSARQKWRAFAFRAHGEASWPPYSSVLRMEARVGAGLRSAMGRAALRSVRTA